MANEIDHDCLGRSCGRRCSRRSARTKEGGWGIGLFQARDIIERHGGTIVVISAPGQGTTFRVRLPIAGEDSAPVDSGARREGAA